MRNYYLLILAVLLTACTSIQVQEIDPSQKISHICIQNNPKVVVGDFVRVVRKGFERHGITTEAYKGAKPGHCEFHLTYTALKTWDVGVYMHHAELQIYKGAKPIAYAEYHLTGKGGLSLAKWASVESKMTPVIDKLLANYNPGIVDSYRKPVPDQKSVSGAPKATSSKAKRLLELKQWFGDGLISEKEYISEKKKVLGQ